MWWAGDEHGWVIEHDLPLSPREIQFAKEFTLKVQRDRLKTLPPGDRKEECARTIAALVMDRVTQNICKTGDIVLYDAWKSEGKRIFT